MSGGIVPILPLCEFSDLFKLDGEELLKRGLEYLEKECISEAIKCFEVGYHKDHLESTYQLSRCCSRFSENSLTKKFKHIDFKKFCADKGHIEASFNIGVKYFHDKNYDKAIHYLQISYNGGYLDSCWHLVGALQKNGKYYEAIACLNDVINKTEKSAVYIHEQATFSLANILMCHEIDIEKGITMLLELGKNNHYTAIDTIIDIFKRPDYIYYEITSETIKKIHEVAYDVIQPKLIDGDMFYEYVMGLHELYYKRDARTWFERSAKKGFSRSQVEIAQLDLKEIDTKFVNGLRYYRDNSWSDGYIQIVKDTFESDENYLNIANLLIAMDDETKELKEKITELEKTIAEKDEHIEELKLAPGPEYLKAMESFNDTVAFLVNKN